MMIKFRRHRCLYRLIYTLSIIPISINYRLGSIALFDKLREDALVATEI
jgi:hypothetical protein